MLSLYISNSSSSNVLRASNIYFELNEIDMSSDVFLSTFTLSSDFPISLAYEETINSLFLVSIFTMFFFYFCVVM